MDKEIVISIKTVLFTLLLILGVYLLYQLGPILIILAVSFVLVVSMEHPIQFLMKQTLMNRPLKRSISVIIMYFTFVLGIVAIFTVGLPPVLNQAQKLIVNLAKITVGLPWIRDAEISVSALLPNITSASGSVFSTTFSILSSVIGVLTVLAVSVYMSLDWENIKNRLYSLFTGNLRKEVQAVVEEIEVSIGHWVKGQLLLMLIIGLMSLIGLSLLKVDYPLALSLIAGLLEIVPVLGPIIALLLAGVVGFSDSVAKGLAVIGLFTLIQQLENNLLVPKVMHRVSGFSPLVILLSLLIGSTLFGITGAILAVPFMMILVIIVKHALRYQG